MSSSPFGSGLAMDAVRVTEAAAIAACRLVGRGDEKEADRAAVEAMRGTLNALAIDGRVVIGEGERDEAPMLYVGETLGTGAGPSVDIAVDPLEGTTLTAKAWSGALTVLAWAPRGALLNAPDTYMDKIAVGPGYPAGIVDLDRTPADNAKALAAHKGCPVEEITACVLDRPRHAEIIAGLRAIGVRIYLISDGDIAGVINCTNPATGVDIYLGQGGAPEGVLACAALKCVGGQFQGRLVFRNADERARAAHWGIHDLDRKYDLHDIVGAEAIFAATGVTKGALLDGVKIGGGWVRTHSLVMESLTHTVREVHMRRPIPHG
jgi:fructose-1,6-bisphosphatase II / sedoheptulose-1,7-bisphosphatase